MRFEFSTNTPDAVSADIAIVFTFQEKKNDKAKFIPLESFKQIDATLDGQLTKAVLLENFSGKKGELISVHPHKSILPSRIYILGLGDKKKFKASDLRKTAGMIAKKVKSDIDSLSFVIPKESEINISKPQALYLICEGLLLGEYEFSKYKKVEKTEHILSLVIFCQTEENKLFSELVKRSQLFIQATHLARDLVNEQAAVATPTYLANIAKDIAKSSSQIKCTIFDKAKLEEMGMGAFMGIARASDTPPKFIHLEYTPNNLKSKDIIAFVGKGITFDSGGINVKPGDHMKDMKMDMSGAAVVLGIFSVLSELKPSNKVLGLIAATPNLISANALVPGDVLRAYNGKTIEVLNTDAEGRVTMADSLSYAVKEGATHIIDFATLTGACLVALGDEISGLFSNNKNLAELIKKASDEEDEMVWELPLPKEYKSLNKSEVADIANIPSSRYGGAITAALFLEEFVDEKPWVHLDIAGPAFASKSSELSVKGGTGFGVRLALRFLELFK